MNDFKFAREFLQKQVNIRTALMVAISYPLLLLLVAIVFYNYYVFPIKISSALDHRLLLSQKQAGEAEQVNATINYGWSLFQKYLVTNNPDFLNNAQGQFKKALAMDPFSAAAKYNLALVLKEKREIESAITLVSEIVSERPRHYLAHFLLGQLYVEKGDYPKAEQELRTTLSIESGLANVYSELGLVFEKQGQKTQAIEVYKQALRYDPAEEQAAKRLAELKKSAE